MVLMLVLLLMSSLNSAAMDKNNIITETERLQIRRFTPDDTGALMAIFADKEVMKFSSVQKTFSFKEISDLINNKIIKDYQIHGFGRYAVTKKADGALIGYAGLSKQKLDTEGEFVDLGYAFTKESWGKGYATETAKAIVKYAQDTLKLPELTSIVSSDNIPSQKVTAKSGFTFSKTFVLAGRLHHIYKINFKQ